MMQAVIGIGIGLILGLLLWPVIHRWINAEKPWDGTIVNVRRDGPPVKYQSLRVEYDAWGKPYVQWNGHMNYMLRCDGTVSAYPWEAKWRHVSGPEVDFNRSKAEGAW